MAGTGFSKDQGTTLRGTNRAVPKRPTVFVDLTPGLWTDVAEMGSARVRMGVRA